MAVEANGTKEWGWIEAHSPIFLAVLVGFLAVTLRLAFVLEILRYRTPQEIVAFNGDSPGYLHLAQNLRQTGVYALDNLESRFEALFRTPGYPLFCAVVGGGEVCHVIELFSHRLSLERLYLC